MRKAKLKIIQYVAAGFLVLVLLPAVVLYVAATRTPEDYNPLQSRMTREQRKEVAHAFFVHTINEFGNRAQKVEPFTWSITSDELNQYLASMDAIAWLVLPNSPGGEAASQPDMSFESYASRFDAQMAGLGLGGWCGTITDDGLNLMVKSTKYNKIFSATLEFEIKDEKQMWVRIAHARFGRLMIPKWIIRNGLVKLRESMAKRGRHGDEPGKKSRKDVVLLLESLLDMAIDERPREPVLSMSGTIKPTLIESLDISNGTMTIRARPICRGGAEDSASD
ncbi:MAG: hypothetical protein NT031_14505 [Planctomycetota bacterium]|nr:hypothetical protein [Planctomycetota bacterium]